MPSTKLMFQTLLAALSISLFPMVSKATLPICAAFDKQSEIRSLQSWNELQPVTHVEFPTELAVAIDRHPVTERIRARFGTGHGLAFQLEGKADFGGWLIQGEFLLKVISHVFPQAIIVDQHERSHSAIQVELIDSTQWNRLNPSKFDMSDLKILNQGPVRLEKTVLRLQMGLPVNSRIISAYENVKSSIDQKRLIQNLFDKDLVDIVILSSQTDGRTHSRWGWHKEVPLITSEKWLQLSPTDRPKRAIIFNETRHRLPYMHTAADVVIVMGQANVFEAIHAGRPTYIDEFATNGFGKQGWARMVTAAQRTGLGHPFASVESVLSHLSRGQQFEFAKMNPSANQAESLNTVLGTLENIMNPKPNQNWSKPL